MTMSKVALWLTLLTSLFIGKAQAEVNIIDQNNWKLQVSGFAELDMISDSTRSFREIIGNSPVAAASSANGANGRFQSSVRNSRLNFTMIPPVVGDWKSKGVVEVDFLGFDPNPNNANNAALNTEGGLYNNPTMRLRHGYAKLESKDWEIVAGQTWSLFGYQPYYFMPSVSVAPLPGMAFNRTAQLRGTKNWDLGGNNLSASFGIARPPQADSGLPDLQAGLRMTFCCRGSGSMVGGASARKVEPMSAAVSGVFRKFTASPDGTTNDTSPTAGAVAANIFVPIIAANDKNVSNSLSLLASFTQGAGYGDQFTGFTGGAAANLLAATNFAAPHTAANAPNIDGGIADFDSSGNFTLIQLTTFNVNLQYHLPNDMPDWVSAGYGQLSSSNMDSMTAGATGLTSGKNVPYNNERVYYANYFHDFTRELRVGAEYDYVETQYTGPTGNTAKNIRYQVSSYYMF